MAKRSGSPRTAKQRPFEEYYDEWSDAVYRYLVHMVGAPEKAEDLFQDTWMKALEHRCQLTNPERFGPWILRIARNLTYNASRQYRRKAQVWILSNLVTADGQEMVDLTDQQPSGQPDPRDCAIGAERRAIVQKAIGQLDLASQEMLQLRYFEHLTLPEVAEVMGVPLGTVCTKVHRALKAIRGRLQRQGYRKLHEI